MNVSIFVDSFKYLKTFKLIVSLSSWINHELSTIKYTDNKLIEAFGNDDYEVIESIIQFSTQHSAIIDLIFESMFDYSNNPFCFNVNLIKLLIKHGANVNLKDNFAIRQTVDIGHSEVLKILLDVVASDLLETRRRNIVLDHLLSYAIRDCYPEVLDLLLANVAHVSQSRFCIVCAEFTEKHMKIVNALIERYYYVTVEKSSVDYYPSKGIRMLREALQLN